MAGEAKVYTKWPFDAAEAKRRQAETAKALGVPVEQDIDLGKGVKLTMVLIPAGEFMMGSPEKPTAEELVALYGGQAAWVQLERPQHRVRLTKPFWLGKTEVTQAQWQAVMGGNPSKSAGRPQNPVEEVSWDDCQQFLQKLSARTGQAFRLPTEAQWEYACRAGAATPFHFGNAEEQLGHYAWWTRNTNWRPYRVGSKKPNPWGLHDVHGNVWEWCQDAWRRYTADGQADPSGPTDGEWLAFRGGSWCNPAYYCRSALRHSASPDNRDPTIGFRISMPVP